MNVEMNLNANNQLQPNQQAAVPAHVNGLIWHSGQLLIRLPNVNNQYLERYNEHAEYRTRVTDWFAKEILAKVTFLVYCKDYKTIKSWGKTITPIVATSLVTCGMSEGVKEFIEGSLANYAKFTDPMFHTRNLQTPEARVASLHVFNGLVYDADGYLQFDKDNNVQRFIFSQANESTVEFAKSFLSPSLFIPMSIFTISKVWLTTCHLIEATGDTKSLPVNFDYYRWSVEKLKELADGVRPELFRGLTEAQKTDALFIRCQKSGELAVLAVTCNCTEKHTFEYFIIEKWLLGHQHCPVGVQKLRSEELKFNFHAYRQNWMRARELGGN